MREDKYRVLHLWRATGQTCNALGKRCPVEESEIYFDTSTAAETHCHNLLKVLPFLGCMIYSPEGNLLSEVYNEKQIGKTFYWDCSLGKYSVRLFEWVSGAGLRLDGSYRSEDDAEPLLEFSSYRKARSYCQAITKKETRIECWIYGRDGRILNRGGTEVTLHESGKYTLPRAWWWRWRGRK